MFEMRGIDLYFSWFILAMLAALFWSLVNILDRFIIVGFISSIAVRVVADGFIGLIVVLVIFIFIGTENVSIGLVFISIITGVLLCVFNWMYYQSLQTSDVLLVSALLQTIPVYSIILGLIFFNEYLKPLVYLGILAIMLGSVFISIRGDGRIGKWPVKFKVDTGVKYILGANAVLVIYYALQKHILSFANNITVFFWGRVGEFIVALLIIIVSSRYRLELKVFSLNVKKIGLTLICIEILNLAGVFAITTASATGPISIITTLTAIQPVFVLIFSMIGRRYSAKGINDALSVRVTLMQQIPALIMILLGVYLVRL